MGGKLLISACYSLGDSRTLLKTQQPLSLSLSLSEHFNQIYCILVIKIDIKIGYKFAHRSIKIVYHACLACLNTNYPF